MFAPRLDRRSASRKSSPALMPLGDSYPRMFFAALLACRTRPAVLKKTTPEDKCESTAALMFSVARVRLAIHLLLSREFVLLLFQLLNDGVDMCVEW